MTAIETFGPVAQTMRRAFAPPVELPLVIVDAGGALEAADACAAMHASGARFDVALIADDARTAQARAASPHILGATNDFDTRRSAVQLLDAGQLTLYGKPQETFGTVDAAQIRAAARVVELSERLCVQSWRAYRRGIGFVGVRRPPLLVACADDARISTVPSPDADAVVIWAPDLPPAELAPALLAVQELHRPVYVVARPAPAFGLRGTFVPPARAERALTRAAVVVETCAHSPFSALAFLRRGFRTVATGASGVTQWAPGVRTFELWSRRSLFAAVAAALGEPAAQVKMG